MYNSQLSLKFPLLNLKPSFNRSKPILLQFGILEGLFKVVGIMISSKVQYMKLILLITSEMGFLLKELGILTKPKSNDLLLMIVLSSIKTYSILIFKQFLS